MQREGDDYENFMEGMNDLANSLRRLNALKYAINDEEFKDLENLSVAMNELEGMRQLTLEQVEKEVAKIENTADKKLIESSLYSNDYSKAFIDACSLGYARIVKILLDHAEKLLIDINKKGGNFDCCPLEHALHLSKAPINAVVLLLIANENLIINSEERALLQKKAMLINTSYIECLEKTINNKIVNELCKAASNNVCFQELHLAYEEKGGFSSSSNIIVLNEYLKIKRQSKCT